MGVSFHTEVAGAPHVAAVVTENLPSTIIDTSIDQQIIPTGSGWCLPLPTAAASMVHASGLAPTTSTSPFVEDNDARLDRDEGEVGGRSDTSQTQNGRHGLR